MADEKKSWNLTPVSVYAEFLPCLQLDQLASVALQLLVALSNSMQPYTAHPKLAGSPRYRRLTTEMAEAAYTPSQQAIVSIGLFPISPLPSISSLFQCVL